MSLEKEIKEYLNSFYGTKSIRPDYTTNSKSYYDYLEKVTAVLIFMSKKIDEYDGILSNELQIIKNTLDEYLEKWDENLENFDDSVILLLNEWIDDGTFAEIINVEIFNHKADKEDLEKLEINQKRISRHISEFGAIGDGVTDDYDAFILAQEYFNEVGTGDLYLDNKKYYFDRYRITGGVDANQIEPLYFMNLNGFTLHGRGAEIILKGDIHRSHDYSTSGNKYSYINQLSIYFENCENIKISNLTVNGEVEKMTRDVGVLEGGGYGLRLNGCVNVTIEKSTFKNMSMDSIALLPSNQLFNDIRKICRNISLRDCEFTGSSRQAMTAGHFVGLYAENCKFNNTGKAGGSYGFTSPGLGIDFEQDYDTSVVEEHSRKAVFRDCEILNNRTSISVFNEKWSDIHFINCKIENDYIGQLNDVLVNGKNISFTQCFFNLLGTISSGNPNGIETDFYFFDCDITSGRFGMFESPLVFVTVLKSRINGSFYVNQSNIDKSKVEDNYFFMDKTKKQNESFEIVWRLKQLRLAKNNVFDTNYEGEGFFAADYGSTNTVLNDLFMNEKTRPSYNSGVIKLFNKNIT